MLHLVLTEFGSWAEVLGIAFANTAMASCFLIALACCATRLNGWNASNRHCAWWLVLALVLLLPAIQLARRPSEPPPSAAIPAAHSNWTVVGRFEGSAPAAAAMPASDRSATVLPQQNARSSVSAAIALLVICCCGVLLQLVRLAWGLFASLRLKKTAAAATGAELLTAFSRAAERVHLRRSVSVAISPAVKSPALVGYRRPAILLPAALVEQLQPEELEQVFSHELAHAARYDDWVVALQRILQAVLFFHPLVRFVCWRIDVNREIACDDRVIASVQPARYAACLTRIAELSGFAPHVAGTLPLLSRKSNLVSRVETILDRTRSHVTGFSTRRLLCFACCGIGAGLLGLRSPALLAYPANPQPLIALPSITPALAADPEIVYADTARVAETSGEPQERSSAAVTARSTKLSDDAQSAAKVLDEKQSNAAVSSIEITSQDGATSSFDAQGGADRHTNSALPPGTIVFRRDGQSYIIRDPGTIEDAEKLIGPLDQLGLAQLQLAGNQEKMAEAQKKLQSEIDAMVKRELNPETMEKLSHLKGELQEKLQSLQTNDWEKERKAAEELARDMSSKFADQKGQFGELQLKLNSEMSELQQQLGIMGRLKGNFFEQRLLGNQELQKKLKDLIERAEKNGLAKPLD